MRNIEPQFVVGYDGELTYRWEGRRWCIRHMSSNHGTDKDALVGCMYADNGTGAYPPAELLAHFPGYIGAAYMPIGETYTISTTSGPLTIDRCAWEFQGKPGQQRGKLSRIVSNVYAQELEALGI